MQTDVALQIYARGLCWAPEPEPLVSSVNRQSQSPLLMGHQEIFKDNDVKRRPNDETNMSPNLMKSYIKIWHLVPYPHLRLYPINHNTENLRTFHVPPTLLCSLPLCLCLPLCLPHTHRYIDSGFGKLSKPVTEGNWH